MSDKKLECDNCKNTYTDEGGVKRCIYDHSAVEGKDVPTICEERGDYVAVDKRTPSLF